MFYNLYEQEAGIKYTDDKINKLVLEFLQTPARFLTYTFQVFRNLEGVWLI
ncbi:MAG TPA: hypothetical protein VFU62_11405 [Hanamia sp.]|nr:hypothetical protein [Hanamia sp.]